MTKAILYARVSKDDTSKDNRNLDGQLQMGRDYALEKGYQIVNELAESDKGVSGASIDLPQLNKIRDLAANGAFDVLIVRELDRLSRNLAKQLIVEQELKSHGVEIEYVLADYEDSPEGRLNKHIRATIAEYEREKIKERMVRGKRNKVKAGSVMISSVRPFGYQVEQDSNGMYSLVVDETEAKIVRMIFNWYCDGDSMRKIAIKLSDLAVPTVFDTMSYKTHKKRGYGQWNKSTIGFILAYSAYATGLWVYGQSRTKDKKRQAGPESEKITVEVPTIITLEQFEQAKKQRKINFEKNPRNKKNDYLMSGRVKCGHCKGAMVGKTNKQKRKTMPDKIYFYYFDPASYKNERPEQCSNHYNYSVPKIDSYIWGWIVSLCSNPDVLQEKLFEQLQHEKDKAGPLREQLEIANDLINEHTERLNELIQSLTLVAGSKRAKEAIASQIEQTETTLDKLEVEASKLEKQIASQTRLTENSIKDIVTLATSFGDKLHRVKTFEDKRAIIEMLDVRITLWTDENKTKWCKTTCLVGQNVSYLKPKQSGLLNPNIQHIETIMITHTFNINAMAA